MWSIVVFEAENSVEVVPSNWFEKDLCAWPKKNLRTYIDNQISPNEKCFRYLNARKLGKDISMNLFFYQFEVVNYVIFRFTQLQIVIKLLRKRPTGLN